MSDHRPGHHYPAVSPPSDTRGGVLVARNPTAADDRELRVGALEILRSWAGRIPRSQRRRWGDLRRATAYQSPQPALDVAGFPPVCSPGRLIVGDLYSVGDAPCTIRTAGWGGWGRAGLGPMGFCRERLGRDRVGREAAGRRLGRVTDPPPTARWLIHV